MTWLAFLVLGTSKGMRTLLSRVTDTTGVGAGGGGVCTVCTPVTTCWLAQLLLRVAFS